MTQTPPGNQTSKGFVDLLRIIKTLRLGGRLACEPEVSYRYFSKNVKVLFSILVIDDFFSYYFRTPCVKRYTQQKNNRSQYIKRMDFRWE